jgi:hypothetical protein
LPVEKKNKTSFLFFFSLAKSHIKIPKVKGGKKGRALGILCADKLEETAISALTVWI